VGVALLLYPGIHIFTSSWAFMQAKTHALVHSPLRATAAHVGQVNACRGEVTSTQ
jgi:hypothetical protein